MTNITSPPDPTPPVSDGGKQLALLNYILYFVGYIVGVTVIVALIIAYLKRSEAAEWVQTHFTYQIRTFWIGLLLTVIGGLTSFILIGYLVLAWWFVWTLVRCIKGIMRLGDNRPIEDPLTWMW